MIEDAARRISKSYGFGEIRTPMFEYTGVFQRSVGEDTDIVTKEMYAFQDRGGRELALRPEGTAAVVRAYIEHGMVGAPGPVKLFYYGPMFRHDRPQAGRYRQFYQFGVECFGVEGPVADVEIISLSGDFLSAAGLNNYYLEINSVGCPECRPSYRKTLINFLEPHINKLCPDCLQRSGINPMRVLDCKNPECRDVTEGAPSILKSLCDGCSIHFNKVQELLSTQEIESKINPRMVRGLDYYTRTAFEFISPELGAQSSVGGGGRYDRLVELMGGKNVPAVGMAMGLDRIILAAGDNLINNNSGKNGIYVVVAGDDNLSYSMNIAREIRKAGLPVEVEQMGRSLKSQFRYAGKTGYNQVVILGDDERCSNKATIKNMTTGEQEQLTLPDLIGRLSK